MELERGYFFTTFFFPVCKDSKHEGICVCLNSAKTICRVAAKG